MRKRSFQKQLSLLDLEPSRAEPTERQRLYWESFVRAPFEKLVHSFYELYQESPIFRRRLQERGLDLYMTHPENAFLVDFYAGPLVQDDLLLRQVWSMDIAKFSAERRKHVSAQVVDLLDGAIKPEQWKPEIAQCLSFNHSRQAELLRVLNGLSLEHNLEKDGFKGKVWVFGPPAAVKELFKCGWELGLFI